ncbi:MAG: hypothetical protein NPIRA06_00550 [Nitrospirales bacterium]|nr:MAG: hypothetical protein NPIRA06_00550 [Nitrospirales bacterium]
MHSAVEELNRDLEVEVTVNDGTTDEACLSGASYSVLPWLVSTLCNKIGRGANDFGSFCLYINGRAL